MEHLSSPSRYEPRTAASAAWRGAGVRLVRALLIPAVVLAVAASGSAAWAADHANLDENLPVRLTGAHPIPYGSIEAQGCFSYDRNRHGSAGRGTGGSGAFTFGPQVEVGLFRNFQASVAVRALPARQRQ